MHPLRCFYILIFEGQMINKRFIKYFITFSFLVVSILPIYNFYQYAKKYDFKKSFNLDNVEKYINYTVYKIFNRSMNPEQVITGRDGFLFLGNQYNNILHKTNGVFRPDNSEVKDWADKLKDLQNWYEERGIKFVIVIAPNKHSIYKEKLPNWMKYDGETITDDIVKFSNEKQINILDLRKDLLDSREIRETYGKYGTHWNAFGAYVGYSKTIDFLNENHSLKLRKINPPIIDYFKNSDKDLLGMLKVSDLIEMENSYKYDLNNTIVCYGDINRSSSELLPCKNISNPKVSINNTPRYITNKLSLNDQKALFIGDSFSVQNSQLYNITFSEIWKWHHSHINGVKLSAFVEKHKPDVVVYQIVERAIYNAGIVTAIPKIIQINMTHKAKEAKKIFDIFENRFHQNNQASLNVRKNDIVLNATGNDPMLILNQTKTNSRNVILSYEIESDIETIFELFYKKDFNSKYNRIDSHRVPIKKGNNRINLLIPGSFINNGLRIDPVAAAGEYRINKLLIFEEE